MFRFQMKERAIGATPASKGDRLEGISVKAPREVNRLPGMVAGGGGRWHRSTETCIGKHDRKVRTVIPVHDVSTLLGGSCDSLDDDCARHGG